MRSILAGTVIGALALNSAAAQPVCLARAALLHQLQMDFGERLLWQGRLPPPEADSEAPVLEIFVSPGGGTWTLVHSLPNGLSCFVAAGQRWAPAPAPHDGRKS